ncbi:putative amino acid permease [Encephalitozoon intestinalis ATCC 50506]|uniref:Amino acid permease n=1 Tax=Encephalitozoon intestinalis (strain ATCC 50506) TaxID=876142 RepID=E0SA40_ENCIT|nr:putative amino acid permease [Encephalitozoon intestinalis ATCC 50506]ADM12662.1 putative amino acid permease [Encephalitozoon intestinalis ATCC 50506]UTX46523.1 MJ0609-like membrane protein [Encephalitozoon intestinalis]
MTKGLNNRDAIIAMILAMMGTGITFMPYAFKSAGYLNAIFLMMFFGMGTAVSCYCISYAAKRSGQNHPTYSSLASDISTTLGYAVNISIFFNGYLAGVNFYRYLSDLIVKNSYYIQNLTGDYEKSRKAVVLALSIPFLYLSFKKTLSGLVFTSYLSIASVLYLSFLMIYLFLVVGTSSVGGKARPFNGSLEEAVPFFISSMVCQANMVKIYTEMEKKGNRNIVIVSLGAAVGGMLINCFIGLFGYLVFGNGVSGEIITELSDMDSPINKRLREGWDKNNIMSGMAIYGIMITLFGGYPVQVNPVGDMIFKLLPLERRTEPNRKAMVVLLWFVAVLLNLMKELKTKIIKKFLGATFSNSVAFVYPFIYYLSMRKTRSLVPTMVCCFMIIMSIVVSIYTVFRFSLGG